jgi:protein-disulfide isomerase
MRLIVRLMCLALCTLCAAALPRGVAQITDLKPEQCLGGSPDAPIRIEIFSDFECPACRQLYLETIRPVLKDYCSLDKVCVVYVEFPLKGHKYSRQASRYAKAAQRLGRKEYQAVIDAIFQNQETWAKDGSVDDIVFKALGANSYTNLKKLLLDSSIDPAIDAEVAEGEKREVKSTPTIFVYALAKEQKVEGPLPYLVLKDFFDRIVK